MNIKVEKGSHFTVHNFPFGIALLDNRPVAVSRIGNYLINLHALHELLYFNGIAMPPAIFNQKSLNPFIQCGKTTCNLVRRRLISLFESGGSAQFSDADGNKVLSDAEKVIMLMPVEVGNYTDFYSSMEHATNVGKMFRDPANALLPNWKHLPVAYHGRASSIIESGLPVPRPKGQSKPTENEGPVFSPTKMLDFELEMAFVTYEGKTLGESISTTEAEDYIFGMLLFNDWSARDFQKWEYVPLGPFLAKNFASSVSPWIVMMEALEPFRVKGPEQVPQVLPYLQFSGKKNIDIDLEVYIENVPGQENLISRSNYKYLYWNMNQQLAHHTVNGCNMKAGDMCASGTISGPDEGSLGSMLELTLGGKNPIRLRDGSERKFIEDGDTVIMRGYCSRDGISLGFGEVRTKILPALK